MRFFLPLLMCCLATASSARGQRDERPRLPAGLGQAVDAVAADVDLDGDLDLVRVGRESVRILGQTGSGRFLATDANLALGAAESLVGIAAGNLHPLAPGPDLVVAVSGGPSRYLRNSGSGAFVEVQPSPFVPRGSTAAAQVLVGDVDGVPMDDVVVLFDGAPAQLFRSDGAGGFVELVGALPPFALQSPIGVLTDLDQDGRPDLIVTSRGTNAVPILLLNGGTGRFQLAPFNVTGFVASAVAVGDLNGDLLPDVVFSESTGAARVLRIFENLGVGQFRRLTVPSSFQVSDVIDLAVRDVDGDNNVDAVALQLDGRLRVGYNLGGGQLATAVDLLPVATRRSLVVEDLEGDGDVDLYVAGRTAPDELILGGPARSFWATESVTLPQMGNVTPEITVIVDATGDGDPDIVGLTRGGAGIVLANDGSARFVSRPGLMPTLPAASYTFAAAARLDATDDDLIVAGQGTSGPVVRVLVGTAPGFADETATRMPSLTFLNAVNAVAVGDLVRTPTSVGRTDLVFADASGILWVVANESGIYRTPAAGIGPARSAILALLVADLNHDGDLDLVAVETAGRFGVLLGDGLGGFAAQPPVSLGVPLTHAVIGGLNSDANADLLLAPAGLGVVAFYAGRGDGTFVDLTSTLPPTLPNDVSALAVAPDGGAFVASRTRREVVRFARSGGAFTVPKTVALRGAGIASSFQFADLDVEGDVDVLVGYQDIAPAVLFGERSQLQQTGVCQIGRELAFAMHGPPNGAAVVFLGFAPFRFPIPPWGLLRLSPTGLTQLLSVNFPTDGQVQVSLPTSPAFSPVELLFQGATLDAGLNIRFTNLEFVVLVR